MFQLLFWANAWSSSGSISWFCYSFLFSYDWWSGFKVPSKTSIKLERHREDQDSKVLLLVFLLLELNLGFWLKMVLVVLMLVLWSFPFWVITFWQKGGLFCSYFSLFSSCDRGSKEFLKGSFSYCWRYMEKTTKVLNMFLVRCTGLLWLNWVCICSNIW